MLTAERGSLAELLAAHGLDGVPEAELANDGWSGSRLTRLERDGRRYVLKRTSPSLDWIVRATDDHALREGWVAAADVSVGSPPIGIVNPYLGCAREGDGVAILMADLSDRLFAWEGRPTTEHELDAVLGSLATLHATRWWPTGPAPWCPLDRRLGLLSRPSAERYARDGLEVGARFLAGWAAFDRHAPHAARDLVDRVSLDLGPLVEALAGLPAVGLHGDLKLANVAHLPGIGIELIDWQMTTRAPVAVELGWLLVSNVATLPEPPDAVLERYRRSATHGVVGDWNAQVDLAWIVGLLLRGWRKGLDAEAGLATGWGATGAEDLESWCRRAVAAGDRRL